MRMARFLRPTMTDIENEMAESNPPTVSGAPQEVEKEFKDFCFRQVFGRVKGWETTKMLPWRTDKLLEEKVTVEWKISKKQASAWWLQLHRSHGNLKEVSFLGDEDDLVKQYDKYSEGAFESIRAAAVSSCLDRFRNNLASEEEEMKYWLSLILGIVVRKSFRVLSDPKSNCTINYCKMSNGYDSRQQGIPPRKVHGRMAR